MPVLRFCDWNGKTVQMLARIGYLEEEAWTPDPIQDLEDIWERHNDDEKGTASSTFPHIRNVRP
jgi:hypothetical protein